MAADETGAIQAYCAVPISSSQLEQMDSDDALILQPQISKGSALAPYCKTELVPF